MTPILRVAAVVAGLAVAFSADLVRAQTVTGRVPVGTNPVAVAVNEVTNKIYTANCPPSPARSRGTPGSVTVIDGKTGHTVQIPVGVCPSAVAVNPVTNKIYVANYGKMAILCSGCYPNYGGITIIDGATNSAVTFTAPGAQMPRAVAVNTVTNKIYVANNLSRNVTVIDGRTNALATIALPAQPSRAGTYPNDIAVDAATNKVYVTSYNSGSANLSPSTASIAIDGLTNKAVAIIDPHAANPYSVAVNPSTHKIYVVNRGSTGVVVGGPTYNAGSITVIDGATRTTANISDSRVMFPHAIAVNARLNQVYIANTNDVAHSGNGGVTILDGRTNAFLTVIDPNAATASNLWDKLKIAIDAARNRTYVANSASNNVTVIDAVTFATKTIADPAAAAPTAVAVNRVTGRIYVANRVSNNVTIIDGTK